MSDQTTAEKALQIATEAKNDITTHEQVCAERYGHINTGQTALIKSVEAINGRINLLLLAFGGGMFTIIMALVFKG